MNNRPELDGLRALAVIPVMLFHAGIFPGGFVGVDVFFVISGYLITSILILQEREGRLSLIRFYERRARRILPALFLIVLVCLPAAWWLLLPHEFVEFGKSLLSVAAFGSNVYFWQHTDYFAIAAELQPLLHTWSLAVEEQFYLLFPVLLVLLLRVARRSLALAMTAGIVVSFIVSLVMVSKMPSAAFFLLPARGWELLVGAMLAQLELSGSPTLSWRHRLRPGVALLAAGAGLGFILVAVLAFTPRTPFPGLAALLPVVGTALVIVGAHSGNILGRLLSHPLPVGLGLISYGAYLWHQPMLAFGRIWAISEPSRALLVGLLGASLILAYGSWRWVENPIRFGTAWNRTRIFRMTGVGTIGMVAIGGISWATGGFPSRFTLPAHVVKAFDWTSRAFDCFGKSYLLPAADWMCQLGDDVAPPSVLVIGDSHARALFDAFDISFRQLGVHGVFVAASACPPLLGVEVLGNPFPREGVCRERNQAILDRARELSPKVVFLVARWPLYTEGDSGGRPIRSVGRSPRSTPSLEESRKAITEGLNRTLKAYRELGAVIILVRDVPEQPLDVERAYYRAYRASDDRIALALRKQAVPTAVHRELQRFMDGVALREQVEVLSMDALFCDADVCLMGTPDTPYYFDDNHLTIAGAAKVVPIIRAHLLTHLGGKSNLVATNGHEASKR